MKKIVVWKGHVATLTTRTEIQQACKALYSVVFSIRLYRAPARPTMARYVYNGYVANKSGPNILTVPDIIAILPCIVINH